MIWDALVEAYLRRGELDKLHRLEKTIVEEIKRQLRVWREFFEEG